MRGLAIALLSLIFNLGLAISATYYVAPPPTGTNTNPCTQAEPCDFQTALTNAAGDNEDSTIIVAPGTYNLTSTLTYNIAGGDGKLTIEAQDPNNKPVLDGQNARQIMNINTFGADDSGNDITVRNLVFQNGYNNSVTSYGGGLWITTDAADVTVEGCEFSNNTAYYTTGGGAVIYSGSGNVTLTDNSFTGNTARYRGGGAYVYAGSNANLNNNNFESNSTFDNASSAIDHGGGAYVYADGNANLTGNNFTDNISVRRGGGAYVYAGNDANLVGNNFTGNQSNHYGGGGAYVYASNNANLTDNNFTNNSAGGRGGGAYVGTDNNTNLDNNTFSNNTAGYGGGIYVNAGVNANLNSNTFDSNRASVANGGGAYIRTTGGDANLGNNTFTGNESTLGNGGGAYVDASNNANLTDNNFSGNRARGKGSGIAVFTGGDVNLDGNSFNNNFHPYYSSLLYNEGGGAYVSASNNANLTDNNFTNNRAGNKGGGAVVFAGDDANLDGNSFSSNRARFGSGVYADNATLTNNIIYGNSGAIRGGGAYVSNATLINNTIYNNTAYYGGGVYVYGDVNDAFMTNNTIYGNTAGGLGGGVYTVLSNNSAQAHIYNNVIWGNTANMGGNDGDDFYADTDGNGDGLGSPINIFNNNFGSNSKFSTAQSEDFVITDTDNYIHGNNLKEDPMFTDPTNGDFHLQLNSPVINRGNNNAPALPATDFEGDQRIIGGVVDMGADESPYIPPVSEPVFGNRKLSNGSTIKVEDGLFSSVTELSSSPYDCQVPPNVSVISLWLRFVAKVDTGKKGVWIELELTQPVPADAKIGKCTTEGFKLLDNVEVNGNRIRFFVEDGGEYDYDGRVDGYVRDPFAVVVDNTAGQPEQQQPEQPESGQGEEQPSTPPSYMPTSGGGGGGCNTGGMSILLSLLVFAVPFLRRLRG